MGNSISIPRRWGRTTPRRVYNIRCLRRFLRLQMASPRLGTSHSRCLGRDRGIFRVDLSFDAAGELAQTQSRRCRLPVRLYRALYLACTLSRTADKRNTNRVGNLCHRGQCSNLWMAIAIQQEFLTLLSRSQLSILRSTSNGQSDGNGCFWITLHQLESSRRGRLNRTSHKKQRPGAFARGPFIYLRFRREDINGVRVASGTHRFLENRFF